MKPEEIICIVAFVIWLLAHLYVMAKYGRD
jgi:hypothetical protein